MRKTLFSAAMAAAMAIASMPLGTSLASAQVELRIDRNGPQLRLRDDDCDPSYRECRERMRRDHRWEERRSDRRGGCNAERALRKADRMGIRRARSSMSDGARSKSPDATGAATGFASGSDAVTAAVRSGVDPTNPSGVGKDFRIAGEIHVPA